MGSSHPAMAGPCRLSAEKPTCQRLPTYDHCSPRRALARRENVQRPLTTRIDRVELRLNHFVDKLAKSPAGPPANFFPNLIRATDQPCWFCRSIKHRIMP